MTDQVQKRDMDICAERLILVMGVPGTSFNFGRKLTINVGDLEVIPRRFFFILHQQVFLAEHTPQSDVAISAATYSILAQRGPVANPKETEPQGQLIEIGKAAVESHRAEEAYIAYSSTLPSGKPPAGFEDLQRVLRRTSRARHELVNLIEATEATT